MFLFIINKKIVLLQSNYQSINYSEDSKLLILQKDGRYGVTDLNGKQILSVDYEQIRIPGDYPGADIEVATAIRSGIPVLNNLEEAEEFIKQAKEFIKNEKRAN